MHKFNRNSIFKATYTLALTVSALILSDVLFNGQAVSSSHYSTDQNQAKIPKTLPEPEDDGNIYLINKHGEKQASTIIPELQKGLTDFIKRNGNPVAAVVLTDAKTGHILAMAQGKHPDKWDSSEHSALYTSFPAASVFKNVASAAAIEIAGIKPYKKIGLTGGCQKVSSRGVWLADVKPTKNFTMTLARAYGLSCNSFFAKLAIDYLGLETIKQYAKKFGWEKPLQSDFATPVSPLNAPKAKGSSILTVGRYTAGFGLVGMSAVHAAWFNLMIANDGKAVPLSIFQDGSQEKEPKQVLAPETAQKIRKLMHKTTNGGTASSVFNKRRYRRLKRITGGKTGTLTGNAPKGLTNWFTGMMPLDKPEVIVSSVVITHDLWFIKGQHLAAEALKQWKLYKRKAKKLSLKKISH